MFELFCIFNSWERILFDKYSWFFIILFIPDLFIYSFSFYIYELLFPKLKTELFYFFIFKYSTSFGSVIWYSFATDPRIYIALLFFFYKRRLLILSEFFWIFDEDYPFKRFFNAAEFWIKELFYLLI
jgi:hypothetical protein